MGMSVFVALSCLFSLYIICFCHIANAHLSRDWLSSSLFSIVIDQLIFEIIPAFIVALLVLAHLLCKCCRSTLCLAVIIEVYRLYRNLTDPWLILIHYSLLPLLLKCLCFFDAKCCAIESSPRILTLQYSQSNEAPFFGFVISSCSKVASFTDSKNAIAWDSAFSSYSFASSLSCLPHHRAGFQVAVLSPKMAWFYFGYT